MSNVHRLDPQNEDEHRARIEKIANGIGMSVFDALSAEDRQDVLDKLIEMFRPIPAPRAGDVLEAIVRLLPRKSDWTVNDLKEEVSAKGVSASPKEVYNAIGYLTRKGHIRRIGYGRYVVDGAVLVASDDFGGPTASQEDAYRTND
jgi:hypothetical protein